MKVKYSPFNKTYKYITLQNQLAHKSNVKHTKSLTHTNISINQSLKLSRSTTTAKTFAQILKQPLVIHKNSKINDLQYQRIHMQNFRLSDKLKNIGCKLLKVQELKKDYQNYKIYRNICEKYDKQKGCRKDLIVFPYKNIMQTQINSSRDSQFCTINIQKLRKSNSHRRKNYRS